MRLLIRAGSPSPILYLLAAGIAGAAIALRWAMSPWIGYELPLVTLFGAVALCVWLAGYRPAILSAALGYVGCYFLFIRPVVGSSLRVSDTVGLLAYLVSCAIIIGFGELMRRSRAEARERRELLRITLASIGDAVITTDTRGHITYLNAEAESLTGWSRKEAVGQPLEEVFRVVDEDTRRPVENPAIRALRVDSAVGLENHTLLIARDGSERSIDDSAAPIRDEKGAVAGCVLIFRDVSARRRTERALRRSEQSLADFFDNANVAMHWADRDGIILRANQAELDLLGYARDEYVGRSIADFHIDRDVIADILRQLAEGLRLRNRAARLLCKDGSIKDVLINSSAYEEDGKFLHSRCFTLDVTERKRTEEAQARLAAIVSASTDAIVSKTLDGIIRSWNSGAERMFGWTAAEAVGQSIDLIVPPELHDEEVSILQRLRRGERIEHFETVRVTKDGRRIDISLTVSPVRDAEGRVIGASNVSRDVTESKRAARELERLASELSLVADSVPALVSYVDAGGYYRFNNKAYEEWFGRKRSHWTGRHMRDALGEAAYERVRPHMEMALSGQRVHYEDELPYKDGGKRFVSAQYVPDVRPDGTVAGCFVFVTDETERRRTEASRRQFFTLAESSEEFIGMCDLELRPFYVNPAGLRMVGLANLEEAQRTPVLEFFHEDDRAFIRDEFLPRVSREGRGEVETRFRHFRTGETLWVIYSVVTLTDDRGRPSGFGTVTRDITDRKRGEEALREADRRKDEFLAVLAHELRNPLAPLGNMLEVLKRADEDAESRRLARETMERQLRQLVRLVDDLLDLSRITRGRLELRKEQVLLEEVIGQALETSRPLIEHFGHALVVQHATDPVLVHGDPVRLSQVFSNLLNNSCKYTPAGGQIDLSIAREGGEAVVTVKDNGAGIAPDMLARIFDMFTQGDGSPERAHGGLGIGLTLTRQIVEMHGGSVKASSAGPGLGSEFVVRLPALAGTQAPPPPPPARLSSVPPRRVLVVDDNKDSADSLSLILSMNGHATSVAHDGRAAIETAAQFRPDVVLLDIGLPHINGFDVCRQIREQPWGKSLLMIALTGWGKEEDRRKSKDAGFDAHMVKPVDYSALMELLATMPAGRAEPTMGSA